MRICPSYYFHVHLAETDGKRQHEERKVWASLVLFCTSQENLYFSLECLYQSNDIYKPTSSCVECPGTCHEKRIFSQRYAFHNVYCGVKSCFKVVKFYSKARI